MNGLKEQVVRGGFAKMCSQGANFVVRIGSLMILGRLLDPKDFGLVGMVTALIGVLTLFKDFGLSTASIQQSTVNEGQLSTLFWINMLVGGVLGLATLGSAPAMAALYDEPRLIAVTAVLAISFLSNAAGVQHSAILQRQMRFTAMAVIEVLVLVFSTAVGIGMALRGYGYWSLVGMTVASPIASTVCVWIATAWIPGLPRRNTGVRSMMRFGGTITLNGLVVYVAYNIEKVLLGRYWGADAVGIYGRAYQLISIPTSNLNDSVGGVAFAALSRLQGDPAQLKNYFLKGYGFVLALTVPVTIACALFADDMILVLLGPKWSEAAAVFRFLAPTILVFALINPLAWLLFSLGLVGRSLKIALVIAPLVIGSVLLGLPYGPEGVAAAYSTAMVLWAIPHMMWCVQGTVVSFRDLVLALWRPLFSALVAGGVSLGAVSVWSTEWQALYRLMLGGGVLFTVYLGMLMYALGQRTTYVDLLKGLWERRSPAPDNVAVSA